MHLAQEHTKDYILSLSSRGSVRLDDGTTVTLGRRCKRTPNKTTIRNARKTAEPPTTASCVQHLYQWPAPRGTNSHWNSREQHRPLLPGRGLAPLTSHGLEQGNLGILGTPGPSLKIVGIVALWSKDHEWSVRYGFPNETLARGVAEPIHRKLRSRVNQSATSVDPRKM